jgi:Sulfotransferase family
MLRSKHKAITYCIKKLATQLTRNVNTSGKNLMKWSNIQGAYWSDLQRFAARPAPPDVLIHLHIAKTGGTTLSSMIKHAFQTNEVFETPRVGPGGMRQAPREFCERQLLAFGSKRIRYVSGHIPLGIHHLFESSAKYVTTVRHPIERIISYFFFQAEGKRHYRKDGKPMTFEEYIEDRSDVQLYDYQVRVLCGSPDLDVEVPGHDQQKPSINVQRHHLDQAKKNVEELFLAAAPIEQLTELGLLIKQIYNWPMRRLQTENKNATKARPRASSISAHLIRIIEERNCYDLELYEWVCRRFAEQRELFEPNLSRDYRVYTLMNNVLTTAGAILPWRLRKRLAECLLYAR